MENEPELEKAQLDLHRLASEKARVAAFVSVERLALPLEVPLPSKISHLGYRISEKYLRVRESICEEMEYQEAAVSHVVGLALRLAWYGIWTGVHYVQFLQEQDPQHESLSTEFDVEWHIDHGGLVNGLADQLSDLVVHSERRVLQSMSPLPTPPTDRALYLGLSLYCIAEAEQHAAKNDYQKAFDYVHEAHRAELTEHGVFMWDEATQALREELNEASQKSARTTLARTAASARHSENRAMKQQVFEWCDSNMAQAPSMDTAASRVAGVVVPVAWRTVRDWMTEWRKLRSAGTAQALLGHTTEAMTADYIRHKVGRKVKPSR